jgi:micrococcal nuclease
MPLRKIIFSVLFLFAALTAFADFSGRCVGVSDGDTIKVLRDGKEVKIRLEGIDCPETHQDFCAKAKEFTAGLVFGKEVTVKEKEQDKYGRTVATVFVGETNLNLALVKSGFAWHYKAYSKDKELAAAEREARENRLGVWFPANPVPPWEFRKSKPR